ncbi:MAG: hypothetical protein U9N59_11000 [Campylobacterota bacterium]|nr:hypothetical protein [Campylobacterota bacterium]
MVEFLNQFKPELSKVISHSNKKILCILEGKEELKYIYNTFKLYDYSNGCDTLAKELIKVSWGRDNQIVKNCNFNGGGCYKGIPVPVPAIESYEFEKDNFWLYDNIIVMFDSDKDDESKVEKYFNTQIEDKLFILASEPCFESTLIDYCKCGNCRDDIEKLNEEKYPCDKYKNNFSSLHCFDGVGHLLVHLEDYTLQSVSKLKTINNIVKNKMENSI